MKDENFFTKNYKTGNIFRFANLVEEEGLHGKEILQKYHFCLDSIQEKAQKLKIPIYRDISTRSRNIEMGENIKEYRFEFIQNIEVQVILDKLDFHNLLSLASGRFDQEYVHSLL